ncbi:MAG: hypothetical protein SynsKO_11910 [Synoicihabitans sp.]
MKRLLIALALGVSALSNSAQVLIENWSLASDGTSLSFNLSGNATFGSTPSSPNLIFIGVPGDKDWITSTVAGSSEDITASGTADMVALGSTRDITTNDGVGDYLSFSFNTPNFTDGGAVSLNFSYSGAAVFAPGNLNENDLIVTWGFNTFADPWPDASTKIGEFSAGAVPEPSSFAVLAGLAALGFCVSRRRRHCG